MHTELRRLLQEQGGVVTAAQALTYLTRRGLEAKVKSGALRKVLHGVYGVGNVTTSLKLRGLDLVTGTTVAVCMGTAAATYGFDTERTTSVHVLNPDGRRLRSSAGVVVHRRQGTPLTVVRGRPATTPPWTAIEIARSLRRPRALATLDAALRSGTCLRYELERAIELQAGRRGIATVRELFPLASPLAESPMESEARLVMIDGGLPPPVLQYELVDLQGRVWRLDFAWPEHRVAAEYEGVDWHTSPDAFRRDRKRAAAVGDLGWVVVPIIAEDVRHRPAELVARINQRLVRAA
ncbi:hypothetical protein BST27_18170 [Mycobacterium intermedium]|uniref:DUF559 domain-containing protein n=1 Tax=Mycobacterium intermedium TaxID=28445 RepID=A0A1E3SB82_MYCIE|nr:hypothetical protein [Mycobacterium intermedium]MCV6962304.1 hypothetical protein [Mycobacterium intermedium]ODQ99393.1 hypothetical protein BHQ20_17940 [Mycobacterium intermedium]OPE51166.1 hypothetical protein BV508_07575 [Mycobacterium intermedium]ORB00894.1 hypothetical protein BST27_18170 [Mycobacterium intermedium]